MMICRPLTLMLMFFLFLDDSLCAGYWQMKIRYDLKVSMDTKNHQYQVDQQTVLFNNSPDTLKRIYFHLYMNAFQPGSDMDIRSRTLPDPDKRVGSRIGNLKPDEIGFIKIQNSKVNEQLLNPVIQGTIGWLDLNTYILPGDSAILDFSYLAQVPIQIRRNGRNNAEGIDYSMSQWYIKICQYDRDGWHPNPYVGREFYGIWGDFKVEISIPEEYTVAATGELQNELIGKGKNRNVKTWTFSAPSVHDFVWAADRDYQVKSRITKNGLKLLAYYQSNARTDTVWDKLLPIMEDAFSFIEKNYGPYPYGTYSFIQGGDGGMEYPMATLITGNRTLISLVGVSVHELLHSWYQMLMATNESLYPWMDEGFTNYAEVETMNYLKLKTWFPGHEMNIHEHMETARNYVKFIKSGLEEPLCTHSDHYSTNYAYGQASYTKGAMFLHHIRYLIGDEYFKTVMLKYYWQWRFKHPRPEDFIRLVELESGIELDWFYEYFVQTTKTLDYGIDTMYSSENGQTEIILHRKDQFIFPLELKVVFANGNSSYFYIPLDLMRNQRPLKTGEKLLPYWPWVNPYYRVSIPCQIDDIKQIMIDYSSFTLDLDLSNNIWPPDSNTEIND